MFRKDGGTSAHGAPRFAPPLAARGVTRSWPWADRSTVNRTMAVRKMRYIRKSSSHFLEPEPLPRSRTSGSAHHQHFAWSCRRALHRWSDRISHVVSFLENQWNSQRPRGPTEERRSWSRLEVQDRLPVAEGRGQHPGAAPTDQLPLFRRARRRMEPIRRESPG